MEHSMKDTIKNYGELKKLINHGDKVTLQGKLMTNNKVNEMPMASITMFIAQGYFEVESKTDVTIEPAIEGEFIGKDDQPKNPRRDAWNQQQAAMAQQQADVGQRNMAAQQAATTQCQTYGACGGLSQYAQGLGGAQAAAGHYGLGGIF